MGKVIGCSKRVLNEFQEKFHSFYAMQKYIDRTEVGKTFPDDLNKLVRTGERMIKLLNTIQTTMKVEKPVKKLDV